MPRWFYIAPAVCAAALALPAGASAARDAEVSIMDDQLLLTAPSDAALDRHMARFRSLGADRLRISAFWDQIAPNPGSRTKPTGFDADNGYDALYSHRPLSRAVLSARRHGLSVLLSITTPAPVWASEQPGRNNRLWKPKPSEFALFVRSIASRYGPSIDQYAVLNEPNQQGWLQPQSDSRGLFSPHHYRRLVRAAFPQIRAADPTATILVGELASSGVARRGAKQPVRPLQFLRAFGCVSRSFRPVRSGRCQGFRAARADAIGHHPYEFFAAPASRSKDRDDAAIGDGARLLSTLDRLVARGGIASARGGKLDLHYTEFGYQTDPPDPYAGIPLARQDRWLQEAAYVAWRTPRVRQLNQFRLTDGAILPGGGPSAYREFQSGLMFRDGRKKPSYASFAVPLTATGRTLWGQVRPGGAHSLALERRTGKRWRRVAVIRTDSRGYWRRRVKGGIYRYRAGTRVSDARRAG